MDPLVIFSTTSSELGIRVAHFTGKAEKEVSRERSEYYDLCVAGPGRVASLFLKTSTEVESTFPRLEEGSSKTNLAQIEFHPELLEQFAIVLRFLQVEDHHFISIETTKSSDYKVKQSGFDKSARKRGDDKQYSISHKKTRA
ncbi:hypothetical protein YC2023_104243 [Brassica napus]